MNNTPPANDDLRAAVRFWGGGTAKRTSFLPNFNNKTTAVAGLFVSSQKEQRNYNNFFVFLCFTL
jgi:hypothetical protein